MQSADPRGGQVRNPSAPAPPQASSTPRPWDAPRDAQPCDHYQGGRCCATKLCTNCGYRYADHDEYPWTAGK